MLPEMEVPVAFADPTVTQAARDEIGHLGEALAAPGFEVGEPGAVGGAG
jgi:hypothetical protein